jgi:hypothetical protein
MPGAVAVRASVLVEGVGEITAITRLATGHQQDVVDLSRKPKMIKHLSHRAAEFGIEPIQECRFGWANEIVVSFSGRGEQRRQHLVSKKKQSTDGS